MFNKVLTSDLDACKGVIETLLGIKISRVECIQGEKTVEVDVIAKGVRFDVYVTNTTQVFDVELQMTNSGELPMRARYYQAIADVDTLNKGMTYSKLKDNYTLFLCPFDLFGDGLPVYTFENTCRENPKIKLNDKTLKVFYNFKKYEMVSDEEWRMPEFLVQRELVLHSPPVLLPRTARLYAKLASGKSASKLTDRLDVIFHELRKNPKWRNDYMTLEMMLEERCDEGIAIGEERGRAEGIVIGIQQTQIETARNMLKDGLSFDLIIRYTGISEQQISELL